MHRLGYIHTMASSIALILLTLLAGSASAELFAPEVFSHAPLYAPTAEPDESNGLYNTRLLPKTESTEPASSQARLNSRWISLPVKAPQYDQPPPPGLRF